MKNVIAIGALLFSANVMAIPALQLGEGDTGNWGYSGWGEETWLTDSPEFTVNAYANATAVDGGNGSYAWQEEYAGDRRFAYLVFAGVPSITTDAFDITVMNDGIQLNMIQSGFGSPPHEDPNSLESHGIYDTYFEIYQFEFDGALGEIADTQPGTAGVGAGFTEAFDVTVNALFGGTEGIHMDLFTIRGDGDVGVLDRYADGNPWVVYKHAPFSHDAEYTTTKDVPEPSTLWMLGAGLVMVSAVARRKRQK